jgi:hypothetical protein
MNKIITVIGAGAVAVGSALAYTANYTPADMPNIATDVLGEAGVQVKVYIPLIILGVIASSLVGTFFLIKSRVM